MRSPCWIEIVSEHGHILFRGIVPGLEVSQVLRIVQAYRDAELAQRQEDARRAKRVIQDDTRAQDL